MPTPYAYFQGNIVPLSEAKIGDVRVGRWCFRSVDDRLRRIGFLDDALVYTDPALELAITLGEIIPAVATVAPERIQLCLAILSRPLQQP